MAQCKEFMELLSAKLDGELTAEEARRLEAHLVACEACREAYVRMERVWEALDVLEQTEPSEDLAQRVFSRATRTRRPAHAWRRAVGWLLPTAVAAGIAVTVLVGPWRDRVTTTPTTPTPVQTAGRTVKPVEPETTQIVENLDLLENLELLENLDMLEAMGEDFSAIQTLDVFSTDDQESQS